MAKSKKKPNPPSVGRQIAKMVIKERALANVRRQKAIAAYAKRQRRTSRTRLAESLSGSAAPTSLGYIVAVGDSWFDYPGEFPFRHDDILTLLEERGYNVESAAHAGDAIESMAYNAAGQIWKLARCFEKVKEQGVEPKAILLSGGGNDIAGQEFGMLLNNANSKIAGWNDEIVDGVISQRIAGAYRTMIDAVTTLSQEYAGKLLPIVIHGYDYAVPDGRGFLGGGWFLPGPWMQPGFSEKQFGDLAKNTNLVEEVIDRFNAMLQTLAKSYSYVHYVDLRNTLSNSLRGDAYKQWWANELHPERKGFDAITDKFAAILAQL